jgi:hypothetical protein
LKLFLLLALFSFTVFAQNVDVTDYQVPVSQARTLRFDGSWNWNQTGNEVRANNAVGNLFYRTFYSSLPLAWFINVDASGDKNFGVYGHNVLFDGSFLKYIWERRDWFSFARFTARHQNTFRQVASDLTNGFGYGRYIDATALAKAVRIEDHLLRDEVINDHLPKATMLKIANIIEREDEYRDRYGEIYEQNWLEDISDEIEKSGMLIEEKMTALGTIRMRQVLFSINERVNQRYYGWDVRMGVLFPITTSTKASPGNPNMIISGQYAFPLSWRIQINTNAELFSPIDSSFARQINARVGLDFIYEFSNRINLVLSSRGGIEKPVTGESVLIGNLNLSFWYYLENNIYLTITSGIIKQGNNPKTLSNLIGLQYNLF